MKTKTYIKNYLIYPLLFVIFCVLNKVFDGVPLSAGAYIGLLYAGAPILITALTFMLSFVVFKSLYAFLIAFVVAVGFLLIFYFYRKKSVRPGVEIIIYILICLLPYILKDFHTYAVQKLCYMAVIAIFSLVSAVVANTLYNKRLNFYTGVKEGLCVCTFWIFCGLGIINLFGIYVYKPLAVLIFILISRLYKNPVSLVAAITLSLPAVSGIPHIEYMPAFVLFFVFYIAVKDMPAIVISISLAAAEIINGMFFGFYGEYAYITAVPTLFVIFLTSLIPTKTSEMLRREYNFDPSSASALSVICSNRMDISCKLYNVANVFYEMQNAFSNLKKCTESTDVIVEKMTDEVLFNMCKNCHLSERCNRRGTPKKQTVEKIIRLGIAKGRVTLIDLPKDFTDVCGYTNSIIFEVNRLIGAYCEYIKSAEKADGTKEILSLQSGGLADAIKSLAFSLSKSLNENKETEKKIKRILSRRGAKNISVLCFGSGKETEITIVSDNSFFTEKDIAAILSESLDLKLTVSRAEPVSNGLLAITLKFAPALDAAFGVSTVTKASSEASGDCHSLIKIDESNFLIALSDGMGSGEFAEKTSSSALNLIESLYKAGLDSEYILTLVNKLLAISVDDNFSAIDIALVSLKEGNTSFIKIGSPYGFILSETGIRFIEGSSLPLGILNELHPTTAFATLNEGDVIVMVSDGITDSFGSSGDFVDFLKSAPLHNPQELSDTIINKALSFSNGIPQDDMTAVCVRLIKTA